MSTEAIEKALQEDFPDGTETECYRFVQAAQTAYRSSWKSDAQKSRLIQKTARQNLEDFLEWRSLYGLDYDRPPKDADDSSIWEWAAQKALFAEEARKRGGSSGSIPPPPPTTSNDKNSNNKNSPVDYDSNIDDAVNNKDDEGEKDNEQSDTTISSDNQDSSSTAGEVENKTLPQLIYRRKDPTTGNYVQDKKGVDMVHVLAAMIDRHAADKETWAMAVAFYIDFYNQRNSKLKYCLYVDARAGIGWANPKLIMVVSLIGAIVGEIEKRHPGRCQTLIIFPLPYTLTMIWGSVKGYFSAEINEMMTVCSGPASVDSPIPKDQLQEFVEPNVIALLEQSRIDLFITPPNEDKMRYSADHKINSI